MKKIYILFILICFTITIKAQNRINIQIPFTAQAPNIDGTEESLWDNAPGDSINLAFTGEAPTVKAYWKALWNQNAMYVLISVEDDDHWPYWVSGGNWFEYDQPELYLDLNEDLLDGFGPGDNKGTGHYQIQPGFSDGGAGVPGFLVEAEDYRPGGQYCYWVDGENYVFEYALDYSTMKNKGGETLSASYFDDLDSIGFDACVIDQDSGITTARQRAVWQNVGGADGLSQNYSNMDAAGTITFVQSLPSSVNSQNIAPLSVYPNPVSDYMVVNADFDKLIITNILGVEVRAIETTEKRINIEMLPSGVYIMQVYNKRNPVGMTKFYKK